MARNAFEYRGSPYQADKLRLAFKAQSQSRETLQAIADLKNPHAVSYVQTNFGNGVQVNNGGIPAVGPSTSPSKVLEATNGERRDTGTTVSTIGANSELEAMETINGTKVRGR